jgi:hypothetical protein
MRTPTRRQLLARGAAVAATGLVTDPVAARAATTKPVPSDGEIVAMIAGIELLVAYVYDRAITSARLPPAVLTLAQEIVGHERTHADTLVAQLPALDGGTIAAPGPPRDDAAAEKALATHHTKVVLGHSRTSREWIRLLFDIEEVLERNYHLAISQLRHASLLRLAAEILASEGQHALLLDELLHPGKADKWLASPFVNGD